MTDKITMIELFSGIGAQERAFRQLGINYEVINTCDCDKDAVLSYAAMRCDFKKELVKYEFPSQNQMVEELQAKNLGYDFKNNKHTITNRTPIKKLKQYYLADKLSKNLGDISKVEKLPYVDLATYSYPCTDLSVAGKGEGMVNKCDKCEYTWPIDFEQPENNNICPKCENIDIKSTRSGLLGQVQRLLTVSYEEGTLPKYLLLENVKNLVGTKFKPQFEAWVKWLDLIGYNTYYKVLNAKHYGVPQNRERIFAISIRKDFDMAGFTFPEQIPLTIRLKDILDKGVDEKYYLPDERLEKILNTSALTKVDDNNQESVVIEPNTCLIQPKDRNYKEKNIPREVHIESKNDGISHALRTNGETMVIEPQVLRAERTEYGKAIRKQYEAREIYEKIRNMREMRPRTDGVANTITTLLKDNYVAEPIVENQRESNVNPELVGGIGEKNFGKQYRQGNRVYNSEAIAMALNAQPIGNTGGYSYLYAVNETIKWRVRKLTTKESWRLMGFTDVDHDRAAKYVPSSQLYKQAGNSIVTNCLVALFSSLFIKDGYKADVWTKYKINYKD